MIIMMEGAKASRTHGDSSLLLCAALGCLACRSIRADSLLYFCTAEPKTEEKASVNREAPRRLPDVAFQLNK
jgi:hypothetical protein